MVSVFSGGNQSVLSATVSGDPSHRREEEEEEWSVSVVVENELGNSSEIVMVLQSEVEWVGALYCAAHIAGLPTVTVTCIYSLSHLHTPQVSLRHQVSLCL